MNDFVVNARVSPRCKACACSAPFLESTINCE